MGYELHQFSHRKVLMGAASLLIAMTSTAAFAQAVQNAQASQAIGAGAGGSVPVLGEVVVTPTKPVDSLGKALRTVGFTGAYRY
jgi:hypothetical protein